VNARALEGLRDASERLNAARAAEREAAAVLRTAILEARAQGSSLSQVAEVLGVSRQRVDQLSR
jgi:DNA-directed RNA polymerase sigma subunit (sigma70/sigma32)